MASQQLFDPDFLKRLARYTISPRIRPVLGQSGQYKSGKKGSSIEFSDVREYLPGDDIRRIDWNAYARSEKLFVKLFMDEREARYHILLDMSHSMNIPEEKWAKARRIAGMLAWLALNSGDRVDLTLLSEDNPYTTKSCAGKAAFYPLLKELTKAECKGSCDLANAIAPLSFHGNGTTFLISDFLPPCTEELSFTEGSSAEKTKHMLRLLQNKKQSVVLIQVSAREEETPELLFSGEIGESIFTLTDSETGGKLKITPSKALLKKYHDRKSAWEQKLAVTAARCQALYVKSISDEPMEQLLEYGQKKGLWR